MIRIIGGEFRSRRLKTPEGDDATRPMTARVKESVFNLLRGWFEGARVLDLCAGVGTMGLEAVSRGAAKVVMVEQNRTIHGLLRENIDMLGCGERATAFLGDALSPTVLHMAPKPVDVLFVDPPYVLMRTEEGRARVFNQIATAKMVLAEKAFVVLRVPMDEGKTLPELDIAGFIGPEVHEYGAEMVVALYMPERAAAAPEASLSDQSESGS